MKSSPSFLTDPTPSREHLEGTPVPHVVYRACASSWGRGALYRAPAPHAECLTTFRERTPWTSLRTHTKACGPSLCFRVACGLIWLSPPLVSPMPHCSSPTAHTWPEGSKTAAAVITHVLSLAPGLRFGHQQDEHPRILSEPPPPGLSIASLYRRPRLPGV
jgi:hypothetical protein